MSQTTGTLTQQEVTAANGVTPSFALIALAGFICAFGLSFAIHALFVGHHHAFGTTREVPWGILIASYAFFASLATGLTIIASLGQIFGVKVLQPIVGRTVFLALAAMATALASISLELENPWRVPIYAFLSPHPESNIWWKSTLYSTYLFFMVINFALLQMGRFKAAKKMALIALLAVAAGNLNLKADMSLIGARGFWRDQYMPLFFATLAVLEACGAIMFLTWLSSKLAKEDLTQDMKRALSAVGKIALGFLLIAATFTAWKIVDGLSPTTHNPEAMHLLLKGDFATNFWVGECILAIALPLLLIGATRARNINAMAAAGLIGLTGIYFIFYDLVIVGQLVPHFHKYNIVDLPRYYSYTPSLHEYMIMIGGIFLFLTAYLIGERFFRNHGAYGGRFSANNGEAKMPNL